MKRGTKRGGAAAASARLGFALIAGFACGGSSQNPAGGEPPGELVCLGTLEGYCCPAQTTPPTCFLRFTDAEECGSWPASTRVAVFPAPCQGMTAVRTTISSFTYSSFYIYGSGGTLYAIGDDATSSTAIECGAGPTTFVVPEACASIWLGDGETCTNGTESPESVCN